MINDVWMTRTLKKSLTLIIVYWADANTCICTELRKYVRGGSRCVPPPPSGANWVLKTSGCVFPFWKNSIFMKTFSSPPRRQTLHGRLGDRFSTWSMIIIIHVFINIHQYDRHFIHVTMTRVDCRALFSAGPLQLNNPSAEHCSTNQS